MPSTGRAMTSHQTDGFVAAAARRVLETDW
jgi:hypothetical protein